jgi:hypothetical protein
VREVLVPNVELHALTLHQHSGSVLLGESGSPPSITTSKTNCPVSCVLFGTSCSVPSSRSLDTSGKVLDSPTLIACERKSSS